MKKVIIVSIVLFYAFAKANKVNAQQDAQYTEYMYNTLSINPAYAGSRESLSILGLHRSQWMGLDGAPRTQTLSVHSPLGDTNRVGIGLNVINDNIFITNETYADVSFSYTIPTSDYGKLAFGIKGGIHVLDVDYSKASAFENGDAFATGQADIDNKLSPQVGLGAFYYTDKFYLGLSAPNILETEHFDGGDNSNTPNTSYLARERVNYYATSGYVFNVGDDIKLKPAALVKWVSGAPLQVDVTANALIRERLTLGLGYRWSASLSALAGFQITDNLMLGLAYDRETTGLEQYNDGSFEVFLRFEIFKTAAQQLVSPRFF